MQGQIDQGRRDNAACGQLGASTPTLSRRHAHAAGAGGPAAARRPVAQRARRRPRVARHPRGPEPHARARACTRRCTRWTRDAQRQREQREAASRRRVFNQRQSAGSQVARRRRRRRRDAAAAAAEACAHPAASTSPSAQDPRLHPLHPRATARKTCQGAAAPAITTRRWCAGSRRSIPREGPLPRARAQHRRWTAHEKKTKRAAELGFFAERIAEIEKASSRLTRPLPLIDQLRNPRPNRPAPSSPEAPPIPPPSPPRPLARRSRETQTEAKRPRPPRGPTAEASGSRSRRSSTGLSSPCSSRRTRCCRGEADNGEIADAERRVAEAAGQRAPGPRPAVAARR